MFVIFVIGLMILTNLHNGIDLFYGVNTLLSTDQVAKILLIHPCSLFLGPLWYVRSLLFLVVLSPVVACALRKSLVATLSGLFALHILVSPKYVGNSWRIGLEG